MPEQTPFFDLTGAFQAQKNYVANLPNRPDTDTSVSSTLASVQTNLDNLYTDFVSASGTSSSVLDHQTQMENVVTTELNRLKKKKENVDLAIESQNRMVKLNDSYRKKYSYYVKIIITIIVFLCIFIFINLLSSYFPLLSYVFDIFYFFLAVTLVFTIYFIYLDVIWRDNMNFDELAFNPPNITDTNALAQQRAQASKLGNLLDSIDVIGCVGEKCCDPETTVWDSQKYICKPKPSAFTTLRGTDEVKPNSPSEFGGYAMYQ